MKLINAEKNAIFVQKIQKSHLKQKPSKIAHFCDFQGVRG